MGAKSATEKDREELSIKDAIELFLKSCRASGLSTSTLIQYDFSLGKFAELIGAEKAVATLSVEDADKFLANLTTTCRGKPLSNKSRRNYFRCVSAWDSWLCDRHYLKERFTKGVKLPKAQQKAITPISPEEFASILNVIPNRGVGRRDRVLYSLLFDTGGRVSEILAVERRDVDVERRVILLRDTKNGDERPISFGPTCQNLLRDYLTRMEGDSRYQRQPRLFCSTNGSPMSRHDAYRRLKEAGREAGINHGVRCSPHTLRHSAAIASLRAGTNPLTVMQQLGHKDISMLKKYTMIAEVDLIAASEKADLLGKVIGRKQVSW